MHPSSLQRNDGVSERIAPFGENPGIIDKDDPTFERFFMTF